MGRQNKDQAAVGPSILLLQERFNKLKRLKEKREERQLIQLLPQSTSDGCDEAATKLGLSSLASESVFQDPLALGLNTSGHPMGRFPPAAAARKPHNFFGKTDVDTSLHL